ncbi:MAG: cytochrome [Leptospirillia bacterium]
MKSLRLFSTHGLLLTVGLSLVIVLLTMSRASAYAGFSRSYDLPCAFCHIQWPKLSDEGNFFRDRGFMLSTTGVANGLDLLFERPEAQNYFPIGFHMTMAYGGQSLAGVAIPSRKITLGNQDPTKIIPVTLGGDGAPSSSSWSNGAFSPDPWTVLSGGLLSPWISFWAEPGVIGPVVDKPELSVESLWVRFDALLGTTLLNIYAGDSSQDPPFSSRRALQKGEGTPYMMYDYLPGAPEIVTNSAMLSFADYGSLVLPAYYDSDRFQMKNNHTSLRYFGYFFENGCGSDQSFSADPCETRLSISLMPNSGLYGNPDGGPFAPGAAAAGVPGENNGFAIFGHLTQSFGGWGATNGERIGVFALVGESALSLSGGTGASPDGIYHREGVDLSLNPIPDGGLNIFGAWEIAVDPASALVANPALFGTGVAAISGLSYMSWFVEADYQPTLPGEIEETGSGSDMIILTANQVDMLQQPAFSGVAQQLPGNFDNVIEFGVANRYWLYGGDRTAISLFAEWQWMLNMGVGSFLSKGGSVLEGYGTAQGAFASGSFTNVTANSVLAGVDFSF